MNSIYDIDNFEAVVEVIFNSEIDVDYREELVSGVWVVRCDGDCEMLQELFNKKNRDMKTTNADKWFSRFIRLRDAKEQRHAQCITCQSWKDVKNMDCGHFIKRQYNATRFSEINANTQCKKCNNFEQGNDVLYRETLVKLYGEEKVLLLEASKRNRLKLGTYELTYITEEYKRKTNELLKTKNLQKWW